MRPEHRSLLRSLFNVTSVATFDLGCVSRFYWLAQATPGQTLALSQLVGPLFALAALYLLINSWLIAFALSFEKDASVVELWWENFPWLSLNYFGGVSVAALLVSHTRSIDINTVGIILPLLIITYLTYKTSFARLADAQRHIAQVNDLYLSTIETLAMAVDAKDQITHGHIRRVQVFAVELARLLGVREGGQLKAIETAALLHDMGKLAIPEHILNKPGKLTTAEFDTMKRHAEIGADLLSSIRFPYPVVPIVSHHHESWNGDGYPTGIGGTDIPLGARILAVVDCFDALTSDRPYRPKMSKEEAFSILRDRSGVMYDPLVVDMFINAFDEISPAAIKAGQLAKSIATFHEDSSRNGETRVTNGMPQGLKTLRSRWRAISSPSRIRSIQQSWRHLPSFGNSPQPACVRGLNTSTSETVTDVLEFLGTPPNCCAVLTIRNGERVTGWAGGQPPTANSDAVLDLGPLADLFSPTLRLAVSCPIKVADAAPSVLTIYSARQEGFAAAHIDALEQICESLALRIKIEGSSEVLI